MAEATTPRAQPKPTAWSRSAWPLSLPRHPPPEPGPSPIADEETPWVADQPGVAFDAALLATTLGLVRRPPALREALAVGAGLARRPQRLIGPLAGLAGDAARIAAGRSAIDPSRSDRRYADQAWRGNPLFRALAQGHFALGTALEDLLDGADLDAARDYRVRLALINIIAALAPANFPLLNPAAMKAVIDTGGGSLVVGAQRLVDDMRAPPRLPARSDPSGLVLGVDIAATPGAVVLRTPVMELIQFQTQTPTVHGEPMLVVPSLVNKYYLTDISPGRSLAEHLVAGAFQTFHISWINPGAAQRAFGLDTYVEAVVDALHAVRAITGAEQVHTLGVCAGGQLLSIAMGYLAAIGESEQVASMSMPVAVLDHGEQASPTGLINREAAERAMKTVERKGFVDGRRLSVSLAWLRPIDSIWWAWVQRYLLAADIPKLDLFHWSEDTTNLPAALVRDLLEVTLENQLTLPGSLSVLGEPIDLRRVKTDAYLIAGVTDNLTPWRSCYRTTAMLGGKSRFVLVSGGHLQAILRPPGQRAGGFRTTTATPHDPDRWLEEATEQQGSWWDHWLRWLGRRSSAERPAPEHLGSAEYEALEPAPGSYVRKRLDD
jgi:polyhydroxyalkanoate synthase